MDLCVSHYQLHWITLAKPVWEHTCIHCSSSPSTCTHAHIKSHGKQECVWRPGRQDKARRPSPGGAVTQERTKRLLSNDLLVAGEGDTVVRPLSLSADTQQRHARLLSAKLTGGVYAPISQ